MRVFVFLGSDSDVEIVFETKVTPEEEKEAIALGLPPKFFSYRQLPDCTCEQCKKDDEYLKDLFKDDRKDTASGKFVFGTPTSTLPKFGKSLSTGLSVSPQTPIKSGVPAVALPTNSASSSVFETPVTAAFNFATNSQETIGTPISSFKFTPLKEKKSETLKDILMQPSKLLVSTTESKDKNKQDTKEVGKSTEILKPFTFTTTQSDVKTNIFSQQSTNLFGGNNAGNLFGGESIFSSTLKNSFKGDNNTPTIGISTSNTSIFNTSSNTFDKNIFGGSTNMSTTGNVFGTNSFSLPKSNLQVDENTDAKATNSTPVFKFNPADNIFGSKSSETSAAKMSFEALSLTDKVAQPSTTNLEEDDEVILKCKSDISFAALAAQNQPDAEPAFAKTGKFIFI